MLFVRRRARIGLPQQLTQPLNSNTTFGTKYPGSYSGRVSKVAYMACLGFMLELLVVLQHAGAAIAAMVGVSFAAAAAHIVAAPQHSSIDWLALYVSTMVHVARRSAAVSRRPKRLQWVNSWSVWFSAGHVQLCCLVHITHVDGLNVLTVPNAAATDPGDVPYEDETGIRYWIGPQGEKLSEDPNGHQYNWVEYYSEDLQKTYYFNQETKVCIKSLHASSRCMLGILCARAAGSKADSRALPVTLLTKKCCVPWSRHADSRDVSHDCTKLSPYNATVAAACACWFCCW